MVKTGFRNVLTARYKPWRSIRLMIALSDAVHNHSKHRRTAHGMYWRVMIDAEVHSTVCHFPRANARGSSEQREVNLGTIVESCCVYVCVCACACVCVCVCVLAGTSHSK